MQEILERWGTKCFRSTTRQIYLFCCGTLYEGKSYVDGCGSEKCGGIEVRREIFIRALVFFCIRKLYG